jgi:hypothetical protein
MMLTRANGRQRARATDATLSLAPIDRITLPYVSLSPRMRAVNSSGAVK